MNIRIKQTPKRICILRASSKLNDIERKITLEQRLELDHFKLVAKPRPAKCRV